MDRPMNNRFGDIPRRSSALRTVPMLVRIASRRSEKQDRETSWTEKCGCGGLYSGEWYGGDLYGKGEGFIHGTGFLVTQKS